MELSNNQSRTKNVFFNVGSNFIVYIIKTIFSFVTRTVFIYCLGKNALGLNGLFTNILSMLSIAELGISSAINFSLYKPLANGDKKNVTALMNFYKKIYRIVGFIILSLGLIMMFFLKYFIKDINSISNVYLIYLLYLLDVVSVYFISYKETLIIADQKKYKIAKIEMIFLVIMNIAQIIFLLLTKNFVVFLSVQILVQIIQRFVINKYISKEYSYIDFDKKIPVKKNDMKEIKTNVKAMFFHKIGDYCINGTDNLIISAYINISTVGLYSNYLTITSLITSLTNVVYNNLTASLGNLIVTSNDDKKHEIFKKMDFFAFLLFGISFVVLINIFNDFILLWVGEDYQLEYIIVVALLISFYLTGMRIPCSTAKRAAGVYDADKFTPIIQSIVNLAVSIILVKEIGLLGVIIGTIASSLVMPSWQRPYLVYKFVLKRSSKEYFIRQFKNLIILLVTSISTYVLFNYITIDYLILRIIVKLIVTSIIYLSLTIFVYRNSDEYKYVLYIILNVFRRLKRNEKEND